VNSEQSEQSEQSELSKQSYGFSLKVASVIWLDMQGTGHAAYVTYCKYPVTQHIQPKGAPVGFACFEFFLFIFLMRYFRMNICWKLKLLLMLLENSKQRVQLLGLSGNWVVDYEG